MKKQLLLSLLCLPSLSVLSEGPPTLNDFDNSPLKKAMAQSKFGDPINAVYIRYKQCLDVDQNTWDGRCVQEVLQKTRDENPSLELDDKMVEFFVAINTPCSPFNEEKWQHEVNTLWYELRQEAHAQLESKETEVLQLRDALLKCLSDPRVTNDKNFQDVVSKFKKGETPEDLLNTFITMLTGIDTGIDPDSVKGKELREAIEGSKQMYEDDQVAKEKKKLMPLKVLGFLLVAGSFIANQA